MISPALIAALIWVESRGNDSACGARGEVGCLQISPAVVDDCNAAQDMVYFHLSDRLDRERSIAMCEIYLLHYATRARLGHEPTNEDYARTWNGGPAGAWRAATLPYWRKVSAILSTPAAPAEAGFNFSGGSRP